MVSDYYSIFQLCACPCCHLLRHFGRTQTLVISLLAVTLPAILPCLPPSPDLAYRVDGVGLENRMPVVTYHVGISSIGNQCRILSVPLIHCDRIKSFPQQMQPNSGLCFITVARFIALTVARFSRCLVGFTSFSLVTDLICYFAFVHHYIVISVANHVIIWYFLKSVLDINGSLLVYIFSK